MQAFVFPDWDIQQKYYTNSWSDQKHLFLNWYPTIFLKSETLIDVLSVSILSQESLMLIIFNGNDTPYLWGNCKLNPVTNAGHTYGCV